MKKLIQFLSVITFTTYCSFSSIACTDQSNKKNNHQHGRENQDNEDDDFDELKQVKSIIKKLQKLTIKSSLKADNQNTVSDLIEQLNDEKNINKIVGDFEYKITCQEKKTDLLKAKKYHFKIEIILQTHKKPVSTNIFVIVENSEKTQTDLHFTKNAQIIKKHLTDMKFFDLTIYKELNADGVLTWSQLFSKMQGNVIEYFNLIRLLQLKQIHLIFLILNLNLMQKMRMILFLMLKNQYILMFMFYLKTKVNQMLLNQLKSK